MAAIVGLGITAIVHVSGTSGEDFELPVSLIASLICGAIALGGLALTARAWPLNWLGALLLLWTVGSYVVLELSFWDYHFAERHERLVGTVGVLAFAAALVATLAAQIMHASQAARLLAFATVAAIAAAAGYGISLIFGGEASTGEARALEILSVLAFVGFFATPFVQRALRRPSQRPAAEPVTSPPLA